jgi:DNA-directed RNA polymerase specialized sigma subunit
VYDNIEDIKPSDLEHTLELKKMKEERLINCKDLLESIKDILDDSDFKFFCLFLNYDYTLKTASAVAKQLGISQQAVSKRLNKILEYIRKN